MKQKLCFSETLSDWRQTEQVAAQLKVSEIN